MTELWQQPAVELAAAIRTKELSSSELLAEYLARIEALNPRYNAVVTLDPEGARKAAKAADDAVARGEELGPLHGLPITVKDAIATAGMRSTGGAEELRDHVPSDDAPAVARVKRAGAIVFGKTNLPKWSGDNQTHNALFGVTRNPWDDTRSPGGSSGGPAVSVACGFAAFDLGTDIGGSVRSPSHFTGICGHKPTFGIVPSRGYLDYAGGGWTEADINVIGPMARSIGDLELLLSVLAGPDDERAGAWRFELPPPRTGSKSGLRIGAWMDDPASPVDAEVLAVLHDAIKALEADGTTVDVEARPVDFAASQRLFETLIAAAVSPGLEDDLYEGAKGLDAVPEEPGENPLLRMGRGTVLRHRDWIVTDAERERLRRQWAAWFEDYDVLLCPVGQVAAQPLSEVESLERMMTVNGEEVLSLDLFRWPGMIGVAYLPAAVVPVGRTAAGLPVGMQVVGPYLGDRTAFAVAAHLESLLGGYEPPPLDPVSR